MININQLQDKIKTCFISYTKQVITQPTRHLIQTMLGDLNSIIHGLSFGFYVYDEWKCSYKLISQSHKKEQNKFVPVLKEINQLQNKEQIISDKKVFLVDHGDLQVYVFKLNEGEDTKPVYFVMQFKRQTLSSTFLSFLYDEMN